MPPRSASASPAARSADSRTGTAPPPPRGSAPSSRGAATGLPERPVRDDELVEADALVGRQLLGDLARDRQRGRPDRSGAARHLLSCLPVLAHHHERLGRPLDRRRVPAELLAVPFEDGDLVTDHLGRAPAVPDVGEAGGEPHRDALARDAEEERERGLERLRLAGGVREAVVAALRNRPAPSRAGGARPRTPLRAGRGARGSRGARCRRRGARRPASRRRARARGARRSPGPPSRPSWRATAGCR